MLENHILLVVILLMSVSLLTIVSEKLRIPYPIFLVVCGLFIGFIPNVLEIVLKPDLIFLIFLPPLLFSAAWNTSWKDFWDFRRAISLLALGLVIFTSFAIAVVSKSMIPGFTLALGFVLGGIISPPDAIAATTVLQKMKMPKRVLSVLEGESLVNDAASLIVFRFAIVAVITGHFTLADAGLDFAFVAAAGIVIGLGIAFVIYAIHRFLPTTSSIDTGITLITPYLMYVIADHFQVSGVLAVVSGGLFLSARSTDIFTYETRIQSQAVWDTVVFLLNGTVFILIGLQLPVILSKIEPGSFPMMVMYGVIISLVTIIVRIIWVFPGTYLPRIISKNIRKKEPYPHWKSVFIVAWSGMRGVISLAAALSIPLTISAGEAFPMRNEILFITFVVILITLVFQGLSLPFVIRKLNIVVKDTGEQQEMEIQLHLVNAILDHLDTNYYDEIRTDQAFKMLRERYDHFRKLQEKQVNKKAPASPIIPKYFETLLELVEVRRKALAEIKEEKNYPDEIIRNIEKGLDHEEARLRVQLKKED
ncbi:MAG TPA: Na+/H+ antiporter [Saprospiraceae bacterium]|nr:Na+/H+ antiporter [Saprospiraceae bacterium]